MGTEIRALYRCPRRPKCSHIERRTYAGGAYVEPWIKCPDCGAWMLSRIIHGRHSDKKCDARCMSAVGPNCECACGGENHGAAHAAA